MPNSIKKQVFVSFRGEDTRRGLLSHLERKLSEKKISMFVDFEMKKGKDIWEEIVGGIQSSLISVIIFSPNYANSGWCVKEMQTILHRNEKQRENIIFVLYNVNLSHMNQQAGTVGFLEDETEPGGRMQLRRSDMKGAGSIVYDAFDSMKFGNDAELVEAVVNDISNKLNVKHPINSEGYIGIEKSIAHIKSLLRRCPDKVCIIGVWGMGGIGKTTIAEEVFYGLPGQEFSSRAFLANVRERSQKLGIISLKEDLFYTLLGEHLKLDTTDGLPGFVRMRLANQKVLIVLDDVNDSNQLETLVGDGSWFGSGSRIIVTSRDKQVLAKVDRIHEVGLLDLGNSLKVFNMNAFKGNHRLEKEYGELSKRVVDYAKGNPSVLVDLANLLCAKDKKLWESHLYKLKNCPNKKIYDAMKVSYDDLDNKEQKIFLDIACFFSGLLLNVGYMKILLKDHEGDNSVAIGLERLKDKSLIKVSRRNRVSMHDIIQGMGRGIVRQECNKIPGRPSRLWDPDDMDDVFKNNMGTESIRSIRINLSQDTKLKLSPRVFFEMSKLQFIDFDSENEQDGLKIFPEGLEYLPPKLRYLRWKNYPLKSLPEEFSPENLVILELPYSHLEILWHGVHNLVNLKQVVLYGSKFLKELPDFSKAINLKQLDTRLCPQLTKVNL